MPKQAHFFVQKWAFRREEVDSVQPWGQMGDRKADFDLNDGGEGDGNHTISRFPGSGMDVVHGVRMAMGIMQSSLSLSVSAS
jgi:hypothetical protein